MRDAQCIYVNLIFKPKNIYLLVTKISSSFICISYLPIYKKELYIYT